MNVLLNESQKLVHYIKRTLGAGGLVALGIGANYRRRLFSITGGAEPLITQDCYYHFFCGRCVGCFLPVYVIPNLHQLSR